MDQAKSGGNLEGDPIKPAGGGSIVKTAARIIAELAVAGGLVIGGEQLLPPDQAETLGKAQVAHMAAVEDAVKDVPDGVTTKIIGDTADSSLAQIYVPKDVGNGEKQLDPIRFESRYPIPSGSLVEIVLRVGHVDRDRCILPKWTFDSTKVGNMLLYGTPSVQPRQKTKAELDSIALAQHVADSIAAAGGN